ncbi:MAG: polysaccharide biosynthesis/export family protein [Pseudomonadales bacterium]
MTRPIDTGQTIARMARRLVFVGLLAIWAVQTGADTETNASLPDYRISPEDVLGISVWREDDLQGEVTVRPDGGISFPLVGDIRAAGKSPRELQADITARLEAYIPDAVVTVSVVEIRGLRIYVSGRVQNPGQYTVGRYVDVLQAISLAGGLTPFADERSISVIRRVDGREVVFDFNYREVQRGRNLEQNIMLQPDDVVVVP